MGLPLLCLGGKKQPGLFANLLNLFSWNQRMLFNPTKTEKKR